MTKLGVLGLRSRAIRRLDSTLAGACADIAAAAYEVPAHNADEWLGTLASLISKDVAPASVATIAIVEPVSGTGAWETHHFAMAGTVRSEVASALEREAREGFPHDDVAFHAGHRGENPRASYGARRVLISDEAWIRSSYATFRRPLGLHEFARGVVPFWELEEPRTLIVQIDLLAASATPGEWEVGLVGGVAPAIARAYHTRFVALREHREAIMRRLTPAQRRVVPHLVEGLSETQIAGAVGRSAHTVHDHTKMIYQALGVSNRLQLRDLWFGRREARGRRGAGDGEDGHVAEDAREDDGANGK